MINHIAPFLIAAALGWGSVVHAAPAQPNVLIIVADDMGFADIGAFGGEIATPNLDALAKKGVKFTSFYTAPVCSPTRSMLLTGRDNHEVGLGAMAEGMAPSFRSRPGYEGVLNRRAVTLAERLSAVGYRTLMAGKWHLGREDSMLPSARGFQRSYAMLDGAANHFGADQDEIYTRIGEQSEYRENGRKVTYPTGRYSADYFTDRMIGFLEEEPVGQPFFAYLTFTEPHWPVQAPPETIAKYSGRYDAGPAALRAERLERMKVLGVAPANAQVSTDPVEDWTSLSPDERAVEARKMEVYAAMVDRLDQNVGRVLDALRRRGELENTLVIFMSDNGPDGGGYEHPMSMRAPWNPIDVPFDNSLENLGAATSVFAYGRAWSDAGDPLFRGRKGMTTEGGIRTVAFAAGAGVRGGRVEDSVLHVMDITPTVMEMTGAIQPATIDGRPSLEPLGASWASLLAGGPAVRDDQAELNWEMGYSRAARKGRFKAVNMLRRKTDEVAPLGQDSWALYDVVADPGETTDLAHMHPEVLTQLIAQWERYAASKGVILPPVSAARP
ncbi:arylsulfatase [Phenylobacterium immobile]|uniref:arylsulfatase n=1 Tax=Phenylobacterium immobile TaxID=21 RepID=UPI000A733587|nr:arylsulfatase [Phenylobacterium immobile]